MIATEEQVHTVLCGSPDRPLRLAGMGIPCYVLDDERRVLTKNGLTSALGMADRLDRLTSFVGGERLKPFVRADLEAWIQRPIRFRLSDFPMEESTRSATRQQS